MIKVLFQLLLSGMQIYETADFIVDAPARPHVSREEGGHVVIRAKDQSIHDRTMLSREQAIQYMLLSMMVGKALQEVLIKQGIPVCKVNYQDMGNWSYKQGREPYFHVHIYGRVLAAPHQPFPEAVYLPDRSTGFYEGFVPLTEEDCMLIRGQLMRSH